MGQFALGMRSLAVRAAVFVIMAALLAWALGGTLWSKPGRVDLPGVSAGEVEWFWRVTASEQRSPDGNGMWQFMRSMKGKDPAPVGDGRWDEAAGPVATTGHVYFAGRPMSSDGRSSAENGWIVVEVNSEGHLISQTVVPDRAAAEQQLARLAKGLPMQDSETIERQRAHLLDPEADLADDEKG